MAKARRLGPKGEPGSNPAGGTALKRRAQHGQTPLCGVGDDHDVSACRRLNHGRDVGSAVRTMLGPHIQRAGRIRMQFPVRSPVRLAFRLSRRFPRSLVPLARRQARIVRRLRRLAQLGFEPSHPFPQLCVLGYQRIDPLNQRQDQCILGCTIKRLQVGRLNHPSFESDSRLRGNPLYAT